MLAAITGHAAAEPQAGCGARLLGTTAVTTVRNVPMINLTGNHRPLTLILDTGAELTVLTPAAAERIGAQPPRYEINHQLRGIGSTLATREVELSSFAAGDVALQWRRLLVAPVSIAAASTGALDGLLGADALSDFDIDLDLPHHRLTFYEKQGCPAAAPSWTGPYTGIAASRSAADRLFFPIQVDGSRFTAIIDTGAQMTTISTAAARTLGITAAMLAHDRSITSRGAAGEQQASYLHRFARLDLGTEAIRSPEMIVTDLALADADIILGSDLLAARRLWLSYGAQRVFLSGP